MRCQKCAKPATYHITDIEHGKPHEYHFCDEHARQHLQPSYEEVPENLNVGKLAKELIGGGAFSSKETADDKQSCPVCSITFSEFRNSGRLGCPYDYEAFRDQLMPLLENIHEHTSHAGKTPKRAPRNSERQNSLIQLRNDLKRAIAAEDYETAARVRDQIRTLEQELGR